MTDLMKWWLTPMIAGTLLLTACEGGDDHGHEHNAEGGPDHEQVNENKHAGVSTLGEVELGGSVLAIALGGVPAGNATLHLDIDLKSGPTPAAIRAWVGNESAAGSIKGKASGSNGHYHADATCPAELAEDDALWIEVESADGTRSAKSLALPE